MSNFNFFYPVLLLVPSLGILFYPYPSFTQHKKPGIILFLVFLCSLGLGWVFAPGNIQSTLITWEQQFDTWASQSIIFYELYTYIASLLHKIAQLPSLRVVLVISLVILWAYYLYRLLFGLLVFIWKALSSFFKAIYRTLTGKQNASEEKQPEEWITHVFFLQQAQWPLLVVLGICFSTLPGLLDKIDFDKLTQFFAVLVWIGAWILLLELASFIRYLSLNVLPQGAIKVSGEDVEAEENQRINTLFHTYQQKFADCLLGQRGLQKQKQVDSDEETRHIRNIFIQQMPGHQASQAQKVFDQYLIEDDVLISETLTYYHLVLYMEIIMHCIHHKGSVLVVAPVKVLDDFKKDLSQIIDDFYGRFSLQSHDWTQGQKECSDVIDLHFCTVEKLDTFIASTNALTETSLMLALHTHALNRTLLRYESGRIAQITQKNKQHKIIKICQVQEYHNDEVAIKSALITRNIVQIKLIPSKHETPLTLAWDNSKSTETKLKEEYQLDMPKCIDAAPLILLNPQNGNNTLVKQAVWLDESYRVDADLDESLNNNEIIKGINTKHLFEELQPGLQMLVVEDLDNIAFSLKRNVHVFPDDKYLLHIISHNYLLRDFMLAVAGENHDFNPRLGIIEGRLTDLAWQILRTLKSARQGVSEAVLADLIDKANATEKFSPDIKGLRELFAQVFGSSSPFLNCSVNEGYATISLQAGNYFSPYRHLTITHVGHEFLLDFPKSDYGLRYGPGILIQLKDKFYCIEDVTDERINVTHEPRFSVSHRMQYYFHRHYKLDCRQGQVFPELNREGLILKLVKYEVGYSRTSTGYVAIPEYADQIDSFDYNKFESKIEYSNPLASALVISLERRNYNQEEINTRKIELTLAALLQEMLKSLFPVESANVVLLSSCVERKIDELDQLNEQSLPSLIYPTLELTGHSKKKDISAIEVVLLEDSETDLGVVNYYASSVEHIKSLLSLADSYLQWAENQSVNKLFHSFNSESLPQYFAYTELKEYLYPLENEVESKALLEPVSEELINDDIANNIVSCDFCNSNTDNFVTLQDKRKRCDVCSKEAVDTVEQFNEQLLDVIKKMEVRYSISLTRNLAVDMVNASTLHERKGECFIPTDAQDPRAIGFATYNNEIGQFIMVIENGFPASMMRMTIAHELTHIWQFMLFKETLFQQDMEIIEGQATFIEVDYARHIDENNVLVEQVVRDLEQRNDCYGEGFKKISLLMHHKQASNFFEEFKKYL